MSDANPYDDLLMDHIKNVRNYSVLDDASHTATGENPLCGDEMNLYLKIERDRIRKIAFQCTCCGISMASASIMTEIIKGMSAADARTLLRTFAAMLSDHTTAPPDTIAREQRAILDTVRKFPSRNRCAVLPWATLDGALDNSQTVISVR